MKDGWTLPMTRHALALILFVSILGLSFVAPASENTNTSLFRGSQQYSVSAIGDNTEDFVDQISNLHSPTDIGTHDVFSDLQDYGANDDAMTEGDTGTAGINEYRYVNGVTTPTWTTVGTNPYLNAQDQPTNYIYTASNGLVSGWFSFADTSGTGSGFVVNMSIYWQCVTGGDSYPQWELDWTGDGVADSSGSFTTQTTWGWATTGTISGLDTQAEINACQVRFTQNKGGGGPEQVNIDAARLGIFQAGSSNYQLDLEVGWTSANYDETNEELCIYPVTGSGWPAEDIKVDVWNGAWTNVISDLTPDQWNNVSINSYLTSTSFEIRFLGGTEAGDTIQDTWEIDAVLIHTWTPSYPPAIDQAPTLDNPSDGDNMYAQFLEYQVTVYVSDQNGFGDIVYLEIGLWDNTRATEYCRFRYNEDTNTFTEEYDAGTYVSLNAGSSSAIESGTDINATFHFTVDWDFPDSTDLDANCTVIDTQSELAMTWYEVNWDVETRLDYSVAPSIDDGSGTADRGNLDGSFSLTGTVIYYTSVDDFPASTAVDVYVSASEYGTNVGPWSDLTLTFGVFDVICYADDVVGQDTYTIKIVEEGASAGGADLYYAASASDSYIADQLVVSISDPPTQRINTGSNVTGIIVSAVYDYDDSAFDGTLTLNDTTFAFGTFGKRGYTAASASGDSHGVTLIGVNDATYCIWDSLTVTITDPGDQRINIGTNATGITVSATYDYDGLPFDGTLTLNNTLFQYGTAQIQYYTVQTAGGGTYGITVISSNDMTWCIWDSLTITITDPSDQRQNINVNATGIVVSAIYDYDGTPFDGSFTLNNTQFSYGTAQRQDYTVQSVSGDSYGISAISTNDVTYFIWDSLTISIADPSNQRININTAAAGIVASAVYDYDGAAFDGTLTLNNTQFTYSTAQIQWYTVDTASGDSYGITAIRLNDNTWCIWDSLTITITDPGDQRIDINTAATGIVAGAVYDYDGTAFDGTLTLNNTQFTYSTAQIQWYTVSSASGDSYGITSISLNDDTWCIWDSLTITITDPGDQRININTAASGITASAVYDYDGATFDGTLTLNNTQFTYSTAQIQWYKVDSASGDSDGITAIRLNDNTWCIWDSVTITITDPANQRQNVNVNASGIVVTGVYDYDGSVFDGVFTLNNTQFTYGIAQRQDYTVDSISGGAYSITAISSNDVTYFIWDSLTITINGPSDQRININTAATGIVASATRDYDGSLFDGTLTLNNTQFTYLTAQVQWYTVDTASGDSYGITVISINDATYCIWDSLTITITDPVNQRQNVNSNATGIIVSAVYDYDGTSFDGTLTLNNTQFSYLTAQRQDYTVQSVSGGAHGITAISSNDVTYFIWDSLTISILGPSNQRININANASGIIATAIYDYDGSTFDGTLSLNNTQFLYGTAQKQDYTVDAASGGTYGITAISMNDVTYCIWDSLTITLTNPLDQRININVNASGIIASAVYDYEGTPFDGTLTLNNTQFSYPTAQRQDYTVQSVSGGAYGISAIFSNDFTYCIWDSLTISIVDPSNQRINTNTNASGIIVSAVYDYDGALFDGTLILNNTQFGYLTAQRQDYTVQSVSGGLYTITAISSNDVTYCIWDSLTITITDPSNQRIDIDTAATGILATAIRDYDGSAFDGVLTLNNTQFSYSTAQIQWYTVDTASGGSYGITAISSNDLTYCIWDSLTIMITDPTDQRIDINENATGLVVSAVYDYDGSAFDGTLTLNNTQFNYPTAQRQDYTVQSVNGGTHGITAISANDVTYCIWDSLTITITDPADQRIDINTNATGIHVTAVYNYDGLAFDGSFTLNNTQFLYGTVQKQGYRVASVSGDSHGITAISANDATWCIWDRLLISIIVDDATPDNGIQANFTLTVYFDYDDTLCTTYQIVIQRNSTWWHSFINSNTSLFVDTQTDTTYTYSVRLVISESTYNVVAFDPASQQVIWSALPNAAPTNDADPALANPDDGSFMYARYKFYIITSNVSDADGYLDIQYVELTLYDSTATTPLWTVRYTVSGGVFSIVLGSEYIQLGSSHATMSGNNLDITWAIKIDWDHDDMLNAVPHQFVTDGAASDSDYSPTTWDVETRLDYSSTPSLSDDRGDVGTADLVSTGSVVYYGSTLSPLANETDVWVVHDVSGEWNGDLTAGSFSITNIGSSASVRLNNYTFRIVVEGAGSGGTDLYYTTSLTDTFITDRIEVYQAGVVDGRININTNCEVWWRARYQYDSTDIQSGLTAVLNGSKTLVWDAGSLYWRWQESSASPTSVGFDVLTASESTYGLTVFTVSTSAQQVIWDALVISLTDPVDQRIDASVNATGILVSAVYAFDGTTFDGTLTLNNTQFTYLTAQKQGYTVLLVSGDSYGITIISSNDATYCIWDSLTISITDPTDQRQNVNVNATGIVVSAIYDYDGAPFVGSLTLNNTQFSYSNAQIQWYTVDSVSDSAYGISAISVNDVTYFIWDSLTVTITDPSDQRINVGENATGIVVSALYDYDGTSFDGTLTLNNTQFDYLTAQIQWYTVDSVGGDSYEISSISANDETWCIWDSLTITITNPLNQRININANATGIFVSAVYDYDRTAFDGTITLNNTQFSYSTAQIQWYVVESVSGSAYGISVVSTSDATYCIWDSLTITVTNPLNQRINIGFNATGIIVSAIYDYDGTPFDGMLTLNNTQFDYLSAQIQWYTVDSVSGSSHGITSISSNDMTYCIWDSLTITIVGPIDQWININTNASGIIVTALYDYDGAVFDGTLSLNNTQFNYLSAQKQGYTVNSVGGDSYGISAISSNDETWCIWDSLTITISDPIDQRINVGSNATGILVSAVYDYDGTPFDGTLTLNNTQFSYATAQIQWYTVGSASGGAHGITAVSVNDMTSCIWDELIIEIRVDDATLLNGVQENFSLLVKYAYDNQDCTTYQIVVSRNATWWHSFVLANASSFIDTNINMTYLYTANYVTGESAFGITAFTCNTLQVIWSLAPNEAPINDSSPVLANADDTDYLYARYRYYMIITSVSDPDGYFDINYVELTLYSDDDITQYWTIRYTAGSGLFSVEFGGSNVSIGLLSNAAGVGDTLTITWYIKIGWNHSNVVNTDILQFVSDDIASASDFYETNWNIETRLTYSFVPSLSEDRGDVNTADLVGTGSVTYLGSVLSPHSNETDVWVIHDLAGAWSGDLAAGSFSISNIGSAATVRMNTYTFKIVPEGAGSGSADLYYTTSLTDTFITDRIEIYEAGVFDGRINVGSNCEVWWKARYEYDSTEITSGLTLELTGSKILVWDAGSLYWRWQETSMSPGLVSFDVISANETTYGLSVWFASTTPQQVIWDSLVITFTDPIDQRIDIGANATGIHIMAVYAYDGALFNGSFVLNNTNFASAVPEKLGYTVLTTSGDDYGITAIGINDVTYCIWDRVLVVSLDADEMYHNPSDNVTITIGLQYEYDGAPVIAGTFAIAAYPLTHIGGGVWEVQVTIGSYQAIYFDTLTACNATLHGISQFNMNSNTATVYWDRLEFYQVSVDDDRINIGDSAEIQWSVRLENAGISITSGVAAQMTGPIALTLSAGVYVASVTESTVGSMSYGILSATLGRMSTFVQTASDATVVWDRVLVTSITATTPSVDIRTPTEIHVTLVYEFDSTPVADGLVNLNDGIASVAMSYNSAGGYWSASVTKSVAGNYTFTVSSVSGNNYGISLLDTAGLSVEVEWIGAAPFALDPMTLMIIGAGGGIAVLGVAIVASRRRRDGVSVSAEDFEPVDFGVSEPVVEVAPAEPETIEPEVEVTPEEVAPEAVEPAELESVAETEILAEPMAEVVEPMEAELPPMDEELLLAEELPVVPELEAATEVPEPEEMEAPIEESVIESETPISEGPEISEEPLPEPELEPEAIEEPIVEPEVKPEYPDYDSVPEEFIEPKAPVDLSTMTKKELLELIPDDIRKTTPPNELKRLTKQELISLVESLRDTEE
jgi:hypothetical protein